MVVPEQRHPLDQRLVGDEHLLDPPVAQLARLLLYRPHDLERLAVDALLLARRLLRRAQLGRTFVDPGRRRRQRVARARWRAADRPPRRSPSPRRRGSRPASRRRWRATADGGPRRSPSRWRRGSAAAATAPSLPSAAAPPTKLPSTESDHVGSPLLGRTRRRAVRRDRRRASLTAVTLRQDLVQLGPLLGPELRRHLLDGAQVLLLLLGAQHASSGRPAHRSSPCRTSGFCSSADIASRTLPMSRAAIAPRRWRTGR